MNKRIKLFLQSSALSVVLFSASHSYADINSALKVYNTPSSAPKVARCQGDQYCNAFYALSKEWQIIPKNYKLGNYNLRQFITDNDGYGLNRGFAPPHKKFATEISDTGATVFNEKARNDADFLIFVKGLAVLHYLEHKK
ncbi:hypothetical protein [Acinetobacter guillouiae]|uniref:hypothetical protein n=1 Tax=Acinetobacter guillouiae TaxID=106649 RepID=UPI003341E0EE